MPWEAKYVIIAALYWFLAAANETWINRDHLGDYSRNQPVWVYIGMAWFMFSTPGVLLLWVLGA